jgi:hypothetical protein
MPYSAHIDSLSVSFGGYAALRNLKLRLQCGGDGGRIGFPSKQHLESVRFGTSLRFEESWTTRGDLLHCTDNMLMVGPVFGKL